MFPSSCHASEENENPSLSFEGIGGPRETPDSRYSTNPLDLSHIRPRKSRVCQKISPKPKANRESDVLSVSTVQNDFNISFPNPILSRVRSNIIPSPLTPAKIRQRRSIQNSELSDSGNEISGIVDHSNLQSSQLSTDETFGDCQICNEVEALLLFNEPNEETWTNIDSHGGEEALVLYHELKAEKLSPTKSDELGGYNKVKVRKNCEF